MTSAAGRWGSRVAVSGFGIESRQTWWLALAVSAVVSGGVGAASRLAYRGVRREVVQNELMGG